MSRLSEQEILREARRVLRRLAGPRQGLFARGAQFVVGRGPASASRITVGADFVEAFLTQGWIAPDGPGRYVVAKAGLALLARDTEGHAAQHRILQTAVLEEAGEGRAVTVNVGESPLARLRHRGLVDPTQFAAGERLRRDFTMAQLAPRMGVNWDAPVVSGARGTNADSISDIAMTARTRLNKALAAAGPALSDLLFDVCCDLAPLEKVEDARGWARRSGRVVLKIALDRLASHYGFGQVREKGAITAWSQEAG